MRFRVEFVSILWLSVIGLSVLASGCPDDDLQSDESDDGGKGGSGAICGKAGAGGKGGDGSCSRAGTGSVAGQPGAVGNGPWPPFGQPENGTCGLPPEPRWGVEFYEDANCVSVPTRGGKDIDVVGMVTEVGDGAPSELSRDSSGDESDLRYVRVQSSDHAYTIVTYGAPGVAATLSAGTEVSLSHHDDTCEYILCSPGNIATALRTDDSDAIRYVRSPAGAGLPENFSVTFGKELCEGRTHCTAWTGHKLEVMNPSGAALELKPGEADELGDYTIHAGMSRQHKEKNNLESARFECADSGSTTTMELLFVRTPPSE
jgi:hypothetical protein